MNVAELKSKSMTELNDLAATYNVGEHRNLRRQELIFRILQTGCSKRANVRRRCAGNHARWFGSVHL